MSETLVVEQVVGPNDRGWFNVTLRDGRTVDTKNGAIADKAKAVQGKEVQGVINSRQRGNFTNYFLNELDGVADEKPANGARRSTPRSTGSTGGGQTRNAQQDERQRVIEKEWAYGRAVELLMASGAEFELPLDEKTISQLDQTAEHLLSKIR